MTIKGQSMPGKGHFGDTARQVGSLRQLGYAEFEN